MSKLCVDCGKRFDLPYPGSQQTSCSRECVRSRERRHVEPWMDEEYGFILDNPRMSARQIGDVLGRSMQSVQHKKSALLRAWSPTLERWTLDETEFIRTTPHMSAAKVARLMGRSESAITNRRFFLRKTEGLDFNLWGGNKSPYWVGPRRLLAKTCTGCGLLLNGSWFTALKHKGSRDQWSPKCTRCKPRIEGKKYEHDRGNSAREAEARMQALTLPLAVNNRQPWLEADHKVLSNPDMLAVEKALALGRTYLAVRGACNKFGYASKVGKGDPMKGRFVIHGPEACAA